MFICLKITQVLSSDKGYGIFITCLTLNEEITTVVKNPMNSRVSAQRPLMALFHCMVRYGSARLGTVRYGSVRVGCISTAV